MISDNFVVGDNVYLRELHNFFFEVLGMMSITHYGCIGDCITDNYASLQVAIDDANHRGLCYLYVPYGRYRYRGHLINRENITFIGNSKAKIFNDKTGEEIEIKQFGMPGCCGKSSKIIFLEKNLILADDIMPDLETGTYCTDGYVVKINGDIVIPKGSTFYYDASTRTLSWLTGYAKYINGEWDIEEGPLPEEEDDEMKAFMTAFRGGVPARAETGENELPMEGFINGGTMRDLLSFSYETGRITVGENVEQIMVGGMLTFTPGVASMVPASYETRRFSIYRDRDGSPLEIAVGATRFYKDETNARLTIAISPRVVAVTGGDEIYAVYDGFDTDDEFEQNTYLTVEALTYDDTPKPHPDHTDDEPDPDLGE